MQGDPNQLIDVLTRRRHEPLRVLAVREKNAVSIAKQMLVEAGVSGNVAEEVQADVIDVTPHSKAPCSTRGSLVFHVCSAHCLFCCRCCERVGLDPLSRAMCVAER